MFSWLKKRRRRKIQQSAWPQTWTEHLFNNARLCRLLDDVHLTLLRQRTQVIVAEKHWEAVDGLTLTEEMQVTIAGQAALMLLGADDFYFDNVSTIVVFPGSFERDVQSGYLTEKRHHAGEAWHGGPVILSWQDVLAGGREPHDGHNLIFHEFAHTLDGIDGEMGGNVIFARPGDHAAVGGRQPARISGAAASRRAVPTNVTGSLRSHQPCRVLCRGQRDVF